MLGSHRSALKKAAQIIVQKHYALLNTNNDEELSWAEGIAFKVKCLLDDSGPSNMIFTDGPNDEKVSQFSFLSRDYLT